jgi:hypothetical protein
MKMVKGYGTPWCGRARRRRARDRRARDRRARDRRARRCRARDRRAATANEITPSTAFVHALFPQSISNNGVALNVKMAKGYGTPWCGRARDRRARDRRARDRRAATANEITPDTAFVHAPLHQDISTKSISNDGAALNVKLVKGYGTPWCGRARDRRARDRRARDRRARDRRAATAKEITANTAFVQAPLHQEHLKP